MRIGLVIYDSLDVVSGGYLYDRQLVRYLERQGDVVEIITLPWRDYARHLTDNFSTELRRRLEGDYDILLQDELNHPSLVWINRRIARRAPVVAIVHHLRSSEAWPMWLKAFYGLVERFYLRSVDAFVFNSHTTQRAVEDLTGRVPAAHLGQVVAHPAGDRFATSELFTQTARAPAAGPIRLLFVGNLIPRKGLLELLTALARLPGVDWRLSIVGAPVDVAYARRVRERLRRPDLAGRVTLHGGLTDAALAAEMAAADVLVVPSSYEGFGLVYLEGMSFGLPAIATTAGAAAEIVTHGVDGFLMPPGDAPALAACITTLAEDRDRLAQMSEAARRRFARHPTWEQTGATIRAFLLTLVT